MGKIFRITCLILLGCFTYLNSNNTCTSNSTDLVEIKNAMAESSESNSDSELQDWVQDLYDEWEESQSENPELDPLEPGDI